MENMASTRTNVEEHVCSNPDCKKKFEKPKLIQYYACPHCLARIEETKRGNCQHFFGYLSEKETNNPIPQDCIECKKVLECMLNQNYGSSTAVEEIKKWY